MSTDTQVEEGDAPPPPWVLRTPIRVSEIWPLPVMTAALAALLVAGGLALGGVLALVVGLASAAVVAVGAVALLVAAWRAYAEQSREASWRLHVVGVVVGVGVAAVVLVATLVVGIRFSAALGFLGIPMSLWYVRSVPRWDRLVIAWASAAVAASCAVLATLGLVVPGLPRNLGATWIGGGGVIVIIASVLAVAQFRIASRAAPDGPLDG